ncbi:hypothetical protein GCM10009575_080870 [Streptomyces rhizosphaericus]|uniref:Uncharacterized protein n=1 Tax=Streptomyces rhizosphaericus TaxID=114699 RepID=A0ABP4BUX0_9ACTN
MTDRGVTSGKRAVVTDAIRGLGSAEAVVSFSRGEDAMLDVVDVLRARGGRAWAIDADMADAVGKPVMVSCLAPDRAALEMTINAFAPGGTVSDRPAAHQHHNQTDPATYRLPFGRTGRPDDIAKVVRFPVYEDSAWITGRTIRVPGEQ